MKNVAIALLSYCLLGAPSVVADHAVVFAYHRFGEDKVPATNIRLAQFDAHLAYLAERGFNVWPLSRIVMALKEGSDIPDRTVALTADDAYRSVMTEAWPRLKKRGWTMTLFVGTDGVDQGIRGYLDWNEIRRLRDEGMEIGAHSAAHGHMADGDLEAARADLERSNRRFQEELGSTPDLLAWPYGEASLGLMKLADDLGYVAAFGQHSGPVPANAEMFYLPRFAMNEAYGKPDRFKLAARSVPLPIRSVAPRNPLLPRGAYPRFEIALETGFGMRGINCFHSHSGKQILRIDGQRASFQPSGNAGPGRSRFNCTASAGDGRFHWYGRQYVTPGGTD
jgi:peptidoglycan/xylan/chitin deacetylase (PgdA/CDA1 family)